MTIPTGGDVEPNVGETKEGLDDAAVADIKAALTTKFELDKAISLDAAVVKDDDRYTMALKLRAMLKDLPKGK